MVDALMCPIATNPLVTCGNHCSWYDKGMERCIVWNFSDDFDLATNAIVDCLETFGIAVNKLKEVEVAKEQRKRDSKKA